MPISVTCECGKRLQARDEHAGRRAKCRYCGHVLIIPGKSQPAYDVFISYSAVDKTTAEAICATLEADRVRCWIAPRDITPGKEWGEAIIDGINQCRIMVLVFSSNSNNSQQVRREVERAVNKDLILLPFRIEDVPPCKAMEYFLAGPHWLDALTQPLENHLDVLSRTVKSLLASASGTDEKSEALEISSDAPSTTAGESLPQAKLAQTADEWLAVELALQRLDRHHQELQNRPKFSVSILKPVVVACTLAVVVMFALVGVTSAIWPNEGSDVLVNHDLYSWFAIVICPGLTWMGVFRMYRRSLRRKERAHTQQLQGILDQAIQDFAVTHPSFVETVGGVARLREPSTIRDALPSVRGQLSR